MGSGYLASPLTLIINTLFDLYILLVLLRFLLQILRADFYNPVSQFIVKLTTPPLRYLRRILPSIAGQDTASVALCLGLIYIKFMLLLLLDIGAVPIGNYMAPIAAVNYFGLLILAIADLIALTFTVFLIAIIVQVIFSWISQGAYNPVAGLAATVAQPVLRPIKKFLPAMQGFDLSPLFAGLGLMVMKMLVIPPILHLATLSA